MLLFSGCSYQYGPPMFGKQNIYMAKPSYDSTFNTELYGTLDMGIHSGYKQKEGNFYAMPGLHMAHAASFYDLSYGLFSYAGGYNVQALPNDQGLKGFYGIGARGSANLNKRFGSFKWRILGIEGAYSREFGGYRHLRSNEAYSNKDTIQMFNTMGHSMEFGLSTEFVFGDKSNENYTSYKGSFGFSETFDKKGSDALYLQLGLNRKIAQNIFSVNLYGTLGYGLLHLGMTGSIQIPLSQFIGKKSKKFEK